MGAERIEIRHLDEMDTYLSTVLGHQIAKQVLRVIVEGKIVNNLTRFLQVLFPGIDRHP